MAGLFLDSWDVDLPNNNLFYYGDIEINEEYYLIEETNIGKLNWIKFMVDEIVIPEYEYKHKQKISNYNRCIKLKEYHTNKTEKMNQKKTIKKNTPIFRNYKTQSPRNFKYK